jgi:type IX secretion system PorP/SprF family membrane protein
MNKIYLFFLISVMSSLKIYGQQLFTSSLYDLQGNLHNPAVAGSSKSLQFGASYRGMWTGISGSPTTALVFGSTYFDKSNIGFGGNLYSDVTGPTSRKGIQTSYSYHIPLNSRSTFSVGIEGRFQQFSIDRALLQEALGNDPILAGSPNQFKGDAGFGVAIFNEKYQVGASVSQLVQSRLNFYSGSLSRSANARLYRHYYFHGNYNWDVDKEVRVIPNLLLIYLPNAPIEIQAGARVEIKNTFWWGLSVRARQSWMLSAGMNIQKRLTVGYSFDIYSTPLSIFDKGPSAHEIILRFTRANN